jgi:hypothetical protein
LVDVSSEVQRAAISLACYAIQRFDDPHDTHLYSGVLEPMHRGGISTCRAFDIVPGFLCVRARAMGTSSGRCMRMWCILACKENRFKFFRALTRTLSFQLLLGQGRNLTDRRYRLHSTDSQIL